MCQTQLRINIILNKEFRRDDSVAKKKEKKRNQYNRNPWFFNSDNRLIYEAEFFYIILNRLNCSRLKMQREWDEHLSSSI